MSTPVAGNQFFTNLENNPKNHTVLKTTTLKVGDTAYIHYLSAKGHHNTGDLLVDGNLVVRDLTLQGSTFEQNLQVDGSTLLNGALDVLVGLSSLNELNVITDLEVVTGNLTVTAGTLDVPIGLSTLNELNVTTDLEVVTGNLTVTAGALNVLVGSSTLESLAVVNNAQLGGGVEVRAYNFDAVGAPHPVTLAMSQQILFFNNGAGPLYNFVLPPAGTARGRKFRFIADGTLVANVDFVTTGGELINGVVLNAAGVAAAPIAAASVSAVAGLAVPTDWIEFTSDGVGRWYLTGVSTAVGAFV